MERIKDAHVIRLIERVGEHYRKNISNRYLRPILLQLQIDGPTWHQVEQLTEKVEMFGYQGFHFDDLYRQIAACARLVEITRNGIPSLRNKLSATHNGSEKILREMVANNFFSNLQVFADLLNELYAALVELDKSGCGKKPPVYSQMPELSNVGLLLAGH